MTSNVRGGDQMSRPRAAPLALSSVVALRSLIYRSENNTDKIPLRSFLSGCKSAKVEQKLYIFLHAFQQIRSSSSSPSPDNGNRMTPPHPPLLTHSTCCTFMLSIIPVQINKLFLQRNHLKLADSGEEWFQISNQICLKLIPIRASSCVHTTRGVLL